MKLNKIIECLEKWAPPSLQEEYDNSGLIIGNIQNEIKGILVTLDCTEEIINEAIKKKCNLIISHHPLIFRPIKKITGSNVKTVMECCGHNGTYAMKVEGFDASKRIGQK